MNKHTVAIKTNGVAGKIVIDGVEIDNVTSYEIVHRAGSLPVLKLTLNCDLQVIGDEILIPLPEPWERIEKGSAASEDTAEKVD